MFYVVETTTYFAAFPPCLFFKLFNPPAKALVKQGVLCPCVTHGLGPNGSLFTIPNTEGARCICNMVSFNQFVCYICVGVFS